MMIGLAPTTGIPLPLVSYGGSSVATTFLAHRPDPRRRVPPVRQRVRKELLVNATPPETRVALLEDGRVVEVLHERRGRQGLVGNVYLGRVHRVLPGMQAAFVVDRPRPRRVPLRRGRVPRAPRSSTSARRGRGRRPGRRRARRPAAHRRPRQGGPGDRRPGHEGPARRQGAARHGGDLAAGPHARLPAGRRARSACRAASPTRPSASGCARILEGSRAEGGFIARTAALGKRPRRSSRRTAAYLTELAARIARRRESAAPPALLHRELDLALRSRPRPRRRRLRRDPGGRRGGARAPAGVPRRGRAGARARGSSSTGSRSRSSSASASSARSRTRCRAASALPSGGSIVIHQTEALVAIDVNTGRFVGKEGLEDTVFATNLEAVPEVARQIRLRDLGGLLVVDFIDMEDPEHRRELFERFEAELARDRARTRVLPDLGVRPDRDHAPALARQPRARADARLPGLLGQRPRQDGPDGRARSAAGAPARRPCSSRAGETVRRARAARASRSFSPRRPDDARGGARRPSESGSSSSPDETSGAGGLRDRSRAKSLSFSSLGLEIIRPGPRCIGQHAIPSFPAPTQISRGRLFLEPPKVAPSVRRGS